jgi:hypothetical protein
MLRFNIAAMIMLLAGAARGAPVAPTAMNGTAENACSKSNLEKRISAYDHSTISECFGWGGVDSAQFSMRWRSLNKDAVKISYGWCPDRCSSYRSGSCTWGSERDEKGTNFEQSLSATVNNRHYKNPVSCVQVKCDNWHETCQLEISSVSVSGNSAEDDFVDKSLPPSLVATTPKLMEPARASEKDGSGSLSLSDDISAAAKRCTTGASACAGASQRVEISDTTYCCWNGKMEFNFPECMCFDAADAEDDASDTGVSSTAATTIEAEAAAKANATLALGSSCDSFYDLKGGVRSQFRGRYEQYGTASTSCNGKPVYWNKAEDTFLYFASGSKWWVGTEERMRDCSAFGWIHSEGDCACPSSSGCQGKWMQNTGQDNSQQMCSAASWCPDCGLWWV